MKLAKAHAEFHAFLIFVLSSRVRRSRPWRSSFSALLHRHALRNDSFVGGAYYVYIVTNQRNGTLYTGVTKDLKRRIWEHRTKVLPGFTAQYGLGRLVYCEEYQDVTDAIAREKQIKAGSRSKKLALIERETAKGRI